MLNPYLNLNSKIFDQDVEQLPIRDGYGNGIIALGENDRNIIVMTTDESEGTRCETFSKRFPDQFVDIGVAEQNLATIAAGMGVSGKTVFIASYATFNPGRNWEPLRTTVVFNHANVKIAGHLSGMMTGSEGATHQATEDIASIRAWPGIDILVPCDAIEAKKATIAAGKKYGPAYLRFSRFKSPLITTEETPFDPLKVQAYWVSDQPVVTIFATGYMVYYALLAAKSLEAEQIPVLVVNVATIKPLDVAGILEMVAQTGAAVSVEDHQVAGGLGGLLSETFAKNHPIPMEFIGLQDTFGESGEYHDLLRKYCMDEQAIIAAVKKILSRK